MMNFTDRFYTFCMLVMLLVLSIVILGSCSTAMIGSDVEPEPGQSLGIVSIPNLRDLGGYKTTDGNTVKRGLVYRSNQLHNISASDMLLFANLNLKNVYDLRTAPERTHLPDEIPVGVNNVWLDVLADDPTSGPANLIGLLSDPQAANAELGDGKVEELFKIAYRQFFSLPSAQIGFRELFMSLGEEDQLPALFHCTTGKDRTGWAAAALLTLLGVPLETVKEDYLRSNDYILPMYDTFIQSFIAAGGDPSIPEAILGVKEEYLDAAFDEMQATYGTIERYFSEGLGISVVQQTALRNVYLTN